jgi:hypothetical protein
MIGTDEVQSPGVGAQLQKDASTKTFNHLICAFIDSAKVLNAKYS